MEINAFSNLNMELHVFDNLSDRVWYPAQGHASDTLPGQASGRLSGLRTGRCYSVCAVFQPVWPCWTDGKSAALSLVRIDGVVFSAGACRAGTWNMEVCSGKQIRGKGKNACGRLPLFVICIRCVQRNDSLWHRTLSRPEYPVDRRVRCGKRAGKSALPAGI